VIGTTAAYLLVNMPLLPLLLRRHFAVPVGKLIAAIAMPMMLGVPYALIVIWIATHHAPTRWISLATHMAASAGVFGIACWMLLLSADERRMWKDRLRLAAGVAPTAQPRVDAVP
jgi:hypothetical protein